MKSTKKPPRLIHLTTTDISLALLLGPQLRAFQEAGYEVIGMSATGPYARELESWGIRHYSLGNATRSMAPHRDLLALAELVRAFRSLRPDIVHTHNPKPGIYGRLAARIARVPVVVNTVHGLYAVPEDRLAKRAVVYSLERIAAGCSNAELLQNEEDVSVLRKIGVPADRIKVLGNGIDLARFDSSKVDASKAALIRKQIGATDQQVVCGVVGRLVLEKGLREIFGAARLLTKSSPNVVFAIVGPADPEKADAITPDEIAMAEAIGNVKFLGMRDDIEAVYAACDLYALASHREGFPRSAMEASAMGLAVVATNIRGCRQVVADNVTGRLVQLGDVEALASAIAQLANDSELRTKMGLAARAKATSEFDQQRIIDTTLATYARLIAADSDDG